MQSQNGDVQLSVRLDTKGIKSDAQKIRDEIQKNVNGKRSSKTKVADEVDSSKIKEVKETTKAATKEVENFTNATKEAETEMGKLARMKREFATHELSSDVQEELDQLNARLEATKQQKELEQAAVKASQEKQEVVQQVVEKEIELTEAEAKELELSRERNKKIKETAEAFNATSKAVKELKIPSRAVTEVERMRTALRDTNEVAKDLAYDLQMFEKGTKYSDEFNQMNSVAQQLTKEFNKGADAMYRIETLGQQQSEEYINLANKTAEIADNLREVNGMLDDMRQSGEAYTEGVNTTELHNVEKAYDAITNKITLKREAEKKASQEAKEAAKQEAQAVRTTEKEQERLTKETQKTSKALQSSGNTGVKAMNNAAKSVRKLNNEMKQTNKQGKKVKLNFLNLLGAAIGIRSLYVLFNKLKSAVTDTMKSLALMNNGNNKTNESISMLMNSLTQLKNAWGAAFAPILNAVAPLLNQLIGLLTKAANAVAQLIAYLSGSKTWIKAKQQSDDYAKSLKKTGNAAKDAAGKLAAFDDLNVLGKDSDSSGGGDSGIDPSKLFEEVPIESWVEELFNKLKELFEKLLPILKHIWDVFKKGFLDAAKDIKARIADIIKNLKKIKDYLIEIFTDPEVVEAAKKWFDSFIYMLGSILGAVALIGVSIAQNLVGGIEKYLSEHKDDIKKYLVAMFNVWSDINDLISKFVQAISYIFSAFGDENGQRLTGKVIGIFAGLFGDITLLASKLGRDLLALIVQPIIDNQEGLRTAFDGLLGSLSRVAAAVQRYTRDMGDAWNKLYDEHIGPFIQSITEGLSELMGSLLEYWNTTIQPILGGLSTELDQLLNDYIKPICTDILELVGHIIDLLKFLWEVILQPLINWVINNIVPPVTNVINGIRKIVEGFLRALLTIVSTITGALNILLEFIGDVFVDGWIEAFKKLKHNVGDLMTRLGNQILQIWLLLESGLCDIINGIIGLFENFVNGAIDGINFLIDAINELVAKASKLPKSMGLDIDGELLTKLEHVELNRISPHSGGGARIPALAQGAVIPPNKEFLAMLGDQKYGTNIEAPLDTIKEAFADVVANLQVQNTGYSEMELDGETFARLITPYVVSELNRQGYKVSVLGA